MHDLFPDWYHEVALEPSDERLSARWAGVESLAKEATVPEMLDLVRLALDREPSPDTNARLVEHFRASDPNFPARDNEHELRILAAASVAVTMESSSHSADAASLAVSNGLFVGSAAVLGELGTRATSYLDREAVRVREAQATEFAPASSPLKKSLDALKDELEANPGGPVTVTSVNNAFTQANAAVKRIEQALTALAEARDEALAEEVDILWWLFGEYSYSASVAFGDLDASAAPLFLAHDLAERTRLLPGPPATAAFLMRALKSAGAANESISIQTMIDAAPLDWRRRLAVVVGDRNDFTPVLECARRSVETDGKPEWAAASGTALHLDVGSSRSTEDLAAEIYREFLLRRVPETE